MPMKTYTLLFTILSLISLSISTASEQTESTPSDYRDGFIVKVGEMAPDFTLNYLDDDHSVKLSSLRGNLVLLQFTDSNCGVCRREMPALEKEIWQVFKDEPFKLIGVDRRETPEKVRKFVQETGVTYPLALDLDASIYDLYAGPKSGITRNVLIDKDGRIVYLTRLYRRKEFNGLIEKIEALLFSCSIDGGC
jgi:peroxiredoxin